MLTLVNGISALAAYTKFHDCDPIKTKMVSRDDQIMPYFMMSIAENIPAIPGIYLSAIFSASLRFVLRIHYKENLLFDCINMKIFWMI